MRHAAKSYGAAMPACPYYVTPAIAAIHSWHYVSEFVSRRRCLPYAIIARFFEVVMKVRQ